jgi:hypothetical protein
MNHSIDAIKLLLKTSSLILFGTWIIYWFTWLIKFQTISNLPDPNFWKISIWVFGTYCIWVFTTIQLPKQGASDETTR